MSHFEFHCNTTGCDQHQDIDLPAPVTRYAAMKELAKLGWGASPVRLSCPGHQARVRLMYNVK